MIDLGTIFTAVALQDNTGRLVSYGPASRCWQQIVLTTKGMKLYMFCRVVSAEEDG